MSSIIRVRGDYEGRNAGTAHGGLVWAVATAAVDADGLGDQTRSALQSLDTVLSQLGTNKTKLLSATVYVTDISKKGEMDRAWIEWIGPDPDHWPQRACVQAALHGRDLVEVTVVAAR